MTRGEEASPLAALSGRWQVAAVAFLVALALLHAEITVTRLLAYQFFYHFVFLVVSLAQLGLAGAGAWVYAAGERRWRSRDVAALTLLSSVVPLVFLVAYATLAPAHTISHAKVIGSEGYPYLATLAILLVALNLSGGMVLTILFSTFRERIGRLYAADLSGAAVGCLVSVGLMAAFGPIRALLASSASLAVAAMLAPAPAASSGRALLGRAPAVAVLAVVALAFIDADALDPVHQNPHVAAAVVRSEWDHIARVDAEAPGVYIIDGDAATSVAGWGPMPPAPEYLLVDPHPRVGIIGVGAGSQLHDALEHDAASVLAIDINRIILDWDRGVDSPINGGIFHDRRVTVVAGEGRHAIRGSDRDFDVIVMHAIDTWTASSQGAYSLTENFLYTREAFRDYLSKLRPDGVIGVRRWLFWPPRENLRLFTTILAALEAEGVEHPEDHVVVLSPTLAFRSDTFKGWGYVLVGKRPFDAERLAPLDAFVREAHFAYLYRPGVLVDTPFTDYARSDDRSAFLADYPYVVTPSSDASPFFFQFSPPWTRWTNELSGAIYGQSSDVLVLCLLLSLALAIAILGVPLFLRRRDARGDATLLPSLAYFACIGLGFMALELPVIQIMTLFLGHPTYALAVVLLGLLAAAGGGSVLMGRAATGAGQKALLAVVALAILFSVALLPAVHALIDLPDAARFALTLLVVVSVGVPLGMPFVAGIRLLGPGRPHRVAWAWAANGAAAVVGTSVLMILMVYVGSTAALLVGAGCYAIALGARARLERRAITSPASPS